MSVDFRDDIRVFEAAAVALCAPGGEPASALLETPIEEASVFAPEPCATRGMPKAAFDLFFFLDHLAGVGEEVTLGRVGSLGVTESGQVVWEIYCPPYVLGRFFAPEMSTSDEVAAWATFTVTALLCSGALTRDPGTGVLVPAGQSIEGGAR